MTTSTSSPTRRVRNPRGSGAALGQEIMATCLTIIDDTGVQGLTLRGLARTVGVSAPAIYAHFADIDAILLAVAERVFADLAEHLTLAADGAASPAARLRTICQAYLDYAELHPGRYQVMFGGQWDATSAIQRGALEPRLVRNLGQDVLMVFTDAVHAHTDTRSARSSSPATDAVVAWLSLHGYAHQRLVAHAFPWPPHITEKVLDHVAGPPQRIQPAQRKKAKRAPVRDPLPVGKPSQ